jgi:hypothetical protein
LDNSAPGMGSLAYTMLVNHTARADFERLIGVLTTIESAWRGVRYIRDELLQQARAGATLPPVTIRQTGANMLDIPLGLPGNGQGCKC